MKKYTQSCVKPSYSYSKSYQIKPTLTPLLLNITGNEMKHEQWTVGWKNWDETWTMKSIM